MRISPIVAFAAGMATTVVALAARGPAPIQVTPSTVTPKQLPESVRFVNHGQHMQAGLMSLRDTLTLVNPFEGNASAVAAGARLYVSYNCVDCHGADGGGAMAPAFVDGRWHFGGSPAQVYESIAQGRPDGMPAWGGLIDAYSIWRLVSYVRSLDQGKQVTTENFTGRTVERTGH